MAAVELTEGGHSVIWCCHVCLKRVETVIRFRKDEKIWSTPPSGWLMCELALVCSESCAEKL